MARARGVKKAAADASADAKDAGGKAGGRPGAPKVRLWGHGGRASKCEPAST